MKRTKQEITDQTLLNEILSSEICRLGFVDKNRAYVPLIMYTKINVFISIVPKGKK